MGEAHVNANKAKTGWSFGVPMGEAHLNAGRGKIDRSFEEKRGETKEKDKLTVGPNARCFGRIDLPHHFLRVAS